MTPPDPELALPCEVWWAQLSGDPALAGLLDDTERRRAGRLAHRSVRERFVTARALLRLRLAELAGTAPTALRLDTTCLRCGGDHGKPRFLGPGPDLHFSIAHAGGRIAVAVTRDFPVGVDIESVAGRQAHALTDLGASFLAPAELADYRELPPGARARALAVWWARKEAVLKATGAGLTLPMREVTVTAPGDPAALRSPREGGRRAMVALHDLTPRDGHVGCVAAVGVASLTVTEHDGDELLAGAAPGSGRTMPS